MQGGGVQEGLTKDDIIYEQPIIPDTELLKVGKCLGSQFWKNKLTSGREELVVDGLVTEELDEMLEYI